MYGSDRQWRPRWIQFANGGQEEATSTARTPMYVRKSLT
jgi:hypothetical protein